MTTRDQLTLAGGLPVRIQHRPGPAILAARLSIRGGSGDDQPGQRGAHQLLAGLMTRGCGPLDAEALADLVEGSGAALRAEAHEDSLVVGLKCAADDASTLLPLMLEMVRRPQLAADQLSLERQLNLQTLQRQREDPFQLDHDRLRHQIYGAGPYGHDPLGIEAELAGIDGSQLRPLVERLGQGGSVLVLCGEPPAQLETLLNSVLEEAPWSTHLPQISAYAGPPSPGERIALQEVDTEQLVVLLGTATVPFGHADSLPLRLLQSHLGVGMSARLFVELREERGLAYDVGVHLPARCGSTPFVMHLSSSAERAEEATDCLLDEWQRILDQPLSLEELVLALAKYQGQEASGRQTCSQIADRRALMLSHGLSEDLVERNLRRATTLTPDDLLQAARRWLRKPCLSLVGPASALAGAERAWLRHGLS